MRYQYVDHLAVLRSWRTLVFQATHRKPIAPIVVISVDITFIIENAPVPGVTTVLRRSPPVTADSNIEE